MAIGVLFQGGNVNQERYQQVLDQVSPGNQPPPGMLYHAAGMGKDGMVVFEVWESQEAAQRFFDEKLGQALEEANIAVHPTFLQIVNTMQP